jgi:hypothetical protein
MMPMGGLRPVEPDPCAYSTAIAGCHDTLHPSVWAAMHLSQTGDATISDMLERLNYFHPFQSKSPWHEDQLTRAFLVVVRLVPLALFVFLDLVRDKQEAQGAANKLPSMTELLTSDFKLYTQTSSVPQSAGRLVSVLMTDENWTPENAVQNSDRGARYDGVLCFDPTWIIVIENKPYSKNIWAEQVNPCLPEPNEIEIGEDEKAVVLLWADVVKRLTALLDVNAVGGAERHLIEDFLEFVDDHFDYLNPYDTFGHCKSSRMLMERRCKRILESIAPERVQWQQEWSTWYIELTPSYPVKMCGLYPEGAADDVHSIELAMYPGDTMNQARAFFNYLALHGADRFSNLRNSNWTVEPNFHFSFIRRGLGHKVTTLLSLDDYLRYWMPPRTIEQVFPDEQESFRSVLMRFVDAGLMGQMTCQKSAIKRRISERMSLTSIRA